ncbi:hypothetical protein POM88_017634 [Heracleum sosnowskyi]|uniref:Trypsin-like serine protease n=1 Tax=Heracleum sosnowskyi TaxID=360622 RepID=A0AAD8IR80_9APIA|nr:hypothetical protein POM88_017634 [Heracleum sosnowskyi]
MNENLKPLIWCIKGVTDVSIEDHICRTTNLGMGFPLSNNGLVMTCVHVVKNATPSTKIEVHTLDNSFQRIARLAYRRTESSLALLEVFGMHDCGALKFSRDRSLTVGQPLVTIGNPLTLWDAF